MINYNMEFGLNSIVQDINKLENEQNLGKLLASHNKIKNKIIKLNNKITNLKAQVDNEYEFEPKELSDEEYELLIQEIYQLLNNNSETLIEKQVEEYISLITKIHYCKTYLQTKKLTIVECDKN